MFRLIYTFTEMDQTRILRYAYTLWLSRFSRRDNPREVDQFPEVALTTLRI